MSSAAQISAKRDARKAAGFCTECDNPRLKGHSVCQRHDELRQKRLNKFNSKRKANRLCYCGAKVKPGRGRCAACLALENQRRAITYAERKTAGLCVFCGRRAIKGRVRCLRHMKMQAQYYQDKKERRMFKIARRGQLVARLFVLHEYSVGAAPVK